MSSKIVVLLIVGLAFVGGWYLGQQEDRDDSNPGSENSENVSSQTNAGPNGVQTNDSGNSGGSRTGTTSSCPATDVIVQEVEVDYPDFDGAADIAVEWIDTEIVDGQWECGYEVTIVVPWDWKPFAIMSCVEHPSRSGNDTSYWNEGTYTPSDAEVAAGAKGIFMYCSAEESEEVNQNDTRQVPSATREQCTVTCTQPF